MTNYTQTTIMMNMQMMMPMMMMCGTSFGSVCLSRM